jgi:hypothetical protein
MNQFRKTLRDVSLGRFNRSRLPFIDLDDQVPPPIRLPADELWLHILNDAKDEFEVYGTAAVFSTCRVEAEDLLDIDEVEIAHGMHAIAGRLALDARMTDVRAARFLTSLPTHQFILRIKYLRERNEGDWIVEDKLDPVRAEKNRGIVEIS